jgi:hypothetical protein
MAYDNYENLGFQVKVDGADSAVSNLDRVIQRLERINQLQGKKVSTSKQVINAQKQEEKQYKKNTNALTAYLGKLTAVAVIARKLGRFVASAIQESANYVENLNLFAVAYGDVYQETLDWALDLADGFGLASNEVLKFAGTFRQLSTSLGLVEDTANSVSKTVTQLGYDMSALFNTSVENAMEKLQSGLFSGNVRPLRAYGIDISQNQIDALFATNEALASLGVNARNLSQSDKVLARLIITLRDGSNAFGTMNREINTLQSQIRILQGSFANFKLAIGDLVYEPTRQALIMLNALIIAATNVIRVFAPLKTTDKNNVFNGVAMGAEEANEQIDELNGKLATFDKFNVLGGQSQDFTSSAITDALTAELAKQQEYYKQQVDLMDDIQNEAKELAKALEPIAVLLGLILTTWAASKVSWFITSVLSLQTGFKGLNTILDAGIIYAFVTLVRAVQDGDYALAALSATAIAVGVAFKAFSVISSKQLTPSLLGTTKAITATQYAMLGLSAAIAAGGLAMIWGSEASSGEKLTHTFIGLAAAIAAAAIAMAAFKQNWAQAVAIGATVAGGYFSIASLSSHADGGYTNANLIMTHENGKREWVGKAAGSSAIVNDTQMSDIMEVAVAKGVYQALSARSAMGGNTPTNETIVVKIGEEAVFNAVRKTARRQGKDFANV